MWFLPRLSAIPCLALMGGALLLFVLDLAAVAYVISGAVAAYLVLGLVFDLYQGSKK